MQAHHGPVDLEAFSRIVRRSQDRARELVGRLGSSASADDPEPLMVATDEWLAAVEELEIAEEELRQQSDELAATAAEVGAQHARYQELFELAPDAYLITDALGAVQEANRAATALFRIPHGFLNSKPLAVFVDPEMRRAFRDAIDRVCAGNRASANNRVEHWETELRPRYGPNVFVSVAATASRDAHSKVATIRWILRDITEQRRTADRMRAIAVDVERRVAVRTAKLEQMLMEREARIAVLEGELAAESEARARAEETAARRADLLGMLSHEVRTPLHASQGYRELLQLSGAGTFTPEQLGYLTRMQQCQMYLVTVLEGVLTLSRLEHGASKLDGANVSVDAVLSTIPVLVEPQIREKGIRYEQDAGDPTVTVRADAEKLRQIALNLVTNAIKFTAAGGRITVVWETCDDTVAIRVRDTGIGIHAADVERIFEPFVQGTNVPAGAPPGVGLGLAISRQLARLMGGDLTVATALGEGATFTLRLPRGSDRDA
ncbi:MAG: ATP-binding protein [Gemmatimonadota bacterium]|nr:ATP-binding protein [Gemmatimonadota bacterium]